MEKCCHLWSGAPTSLLDRGQHQMKKLVGSALYSTLELLSQRRDVASLSLFYRYYFVRAITAPYLLFDFYDWSCEMQCCAQLWKRKDRSCVQWGIVFVSDEKSHARLTSWSAKQHLSVSLYTNAACRHTQTRTHTHISTQAAFAHKKEAMNTWDMVAK